MKRCGGYTLVEVTTAGAVLILASLIAAKGFVLCGQLLNRDQESRTMEQILELRTAVAPEPDKVYNSTLILGDIGEWEVTIQTYQIKKGRLKWELKAVGYEE